MLGSPSDDIVEMAEDIARYRLHHIANLSIHKYHLTSLEIVQLLSEGIQMLHIRNCVRRKNIVQVRN